MVSSGAHHFFGYGPLNFWDNIDKLDISRSILEMKKMGFTHLFLLVPLASFVDDSDEGFIIDDYNRQNYLNILKECNAKGLDVHVRVGYLWEALPRGQSTYARYNNFFWQSSAEKSFRALCQFLKEAETNQNLRISVDYFISWEDFYWPIFSRWPLMSLDERRICAERSGFGEYLKLCNAGSSETVCIPAPSDESHVYFAQFFDTVFLTRVIGLAKSILGPVGFEYRVDPDLIGEVDGRAFHYLWSRSHPGVSQKYIYFHPMVGDGALSGASSSQAIENLSSLICSYAPRYYEGETSIIVDQFNFVDNTYEDWNKISESEISIFIAKSKQLFDRYGALAGLWNTIDWPRDIIANGRFRRDLDGWEAGDDASVEVLSNGVRLQSGSSITQSPALSVPGDVSVTVEICIACETPSVEIVLRCGEDWKELSFFGIAGFKREVVFERGGGDVGVECKKGAFVLNSIKLYDRYYSQGARDKNGKMRKEFSQFLSHFNNVY